MADNVKEYEAGGESPNRGQEVSFLRSLWVLFSSMKTAIALLLVLAAASVLGTVIEQNAMSSEYVRAYGPTKYAIFRALGLTDLYHSNWYRLLLALVATNLTVCSINRLGGILRRASSSETAVEPGRIERMQRSEKLSSAGTVESVTEKVARALKAGSYRVMQSHSGDAVVMRATRGGLSAWGPYLTHLSILVIFAGAIAGNILGFNGYTDITEGQSVETYYGRNNEQRLPLGFSVELRDFRIEQDASGNPTAYKSDLAVYDRGKLVARKVIDVNHPLTYKGVSFFQSSYGLAPLVVGITAPDGEKARVAFELQTQPGPRGMQHVIAGEPFKQIELAGKLLTVFVHNFSPDHGGGEAASESSLAPSPAINVMINDRLPEYKGLDAWSRLGWVTRSAPVTYKGFAVTLEEVLDYTGLQVSKNPGLPVVYAGFGLLLAGVFLSFYVVHRVVRVRIQPSKEGAAVLVGATCRGGPLVFDRDFKRLHDALA